MEPERLASGCGFCSSLHPGTLTEHPISLTQLAHDQFRGVITNLHFVLLAHKGNLGLTKQLDMNQRGSGQDFWVGEFLRSLFQPSAVSARGRGSQGPMDRFPEVRERHHDP